MTRLELVDFRNYSSVGVDLEPGVTVFVGRNGQGKTNLVEALGYLATLGSHRVAADAPLVRAGAERAVIRAGLTDEDTGRHLTAELEVNPGRANRARLNRAVLTRPRDILGTLRTVLFAPEDLAVVKGDPAERRRFLDELLTLRSPRMAGVRSDYDRVLKQRNSLLRSASAQRRRSRAGEAAGTSSAAEPSTLDVWDDHLAEAGSDLVAARLALVEELRPRVSEAYASVADDAETLAGLAYRSAVPGIGDVGAATEGEEVVEPVTDREGIAAALRAALLDRRRDELERGVTLVGPHRDDLVLSLGELPAKGYASHGESWSFALALRLASYALLRDDAAQRSGGEPVLMLDDVFAELDTTRRDKLAELVGPAHQVVVTAAVPDDVPAGWQARRFDVAAGVITPHDE